jgi:hypothetical protein
LAQMGMDFGLVINNLNPSHNEGFFICKGIYQ